MEIKKEVDPKSFDVGVIVARFQVHELHQAHKDLIDKVISNHKQVIIFLGVPVIPNTIKNPLNFATRCAMIRQEYSNVIILPLKDQRSNKKWSENLDNEIKIPFGEQSAVIYGSRDSFIPSYNGRYQFIELISNSYVSGTEVRENVSKEILETKDFRAGVIHANYARSKRPVTYPTVDVVSYY